MPSRNELKNALIKLYHQYSTGAVWELPKNDEEPAPFNFLLLSYEKLPEEKQRTVCEALVRFSTTLLLEIAYQVKTHKDKTGLYVQFGERL